MKNHTNCRKIVCERNAKFLCEKLFNLKKNKQKNIIILKTTISYTYIIHYTMNYIHIYSMYIVHKWTYIDT